MRGNGLKRNAALLRLVLRDEASATLSADINPQPVQGDREPVAQADQEINVGDAPDPPGGPAGQLQPAKVDDSGAFSDRRETAGVLVPERPLRSAAAQARLDHLGHIASLLLGGRRYAGDQLSIRRFDMSGIADHEDVRMARD